MKIFWSEVLSNIGRLSSVAAGRQSASCSLVEALRHARMPFAEVRADHRAGIEPAAIDAQRAAEAAADLEGGFDDGVAGEARGDRLEIGDFPGRVHGSFRILPFVGHRIEETLRLAP
jgi:hypothetical protein